MIVTETGEVNEVATNFRGDDSVTTVATEEVLVTTISLDIYSET